MATAKPAQKKGAGGKGAPAKKKMGRPTTYTQAISESLCDRIASGESVLSICQCANMPSQTSVYKWLSEHTDFAEKYARAREMQADKYAAEIIGIADESSQDTYIDSEGRERTDNEVVARSRLRVDARKWYASKLAPKKYGDKISQEISGDPDKPLVTKVVREIVRP